MPDGLGKHLAAAPAGWPLHGADQRGDGTAVSTGIPRVAPVARAPPARPGGAGTGGAQNTKGKNKVYAVAKGFSTGLFESWEACEPEVKGFKDATFKGFASRADALTYLELHGVTMGGQKEAPKQQSQASELSIEQRARLEAQKEQALQRKREREAAEAAQRAADLAAERRREDPHRHSAAAKTRRNAKEKMRKKEKKRAARALAVAADEQSNEQHNEQHNEQDDETTGISAEAALSEAKLREVALRAQLKALKNLSGAIRKRTAREAMLAFTRGKRVQKREDEDAKRAKRKKRTVKQLRGIAGDARRHKKTKAEGQKRRGQQKKQSKQ
jgi:viroplasmin and RNaseH domain-containing protein